MEVRTDIGRCRDMYDVGRVGGYGDVDSVGRQEIDSEEHFLTSLS